MSGAEMVKKMGPNLKVPPTKCACSLMHAFFSRAQGSGDGYAGIQLGLIFIVAGFCSFNFGHYSILTEKQFQCSVV